MKLIISFAFCLISIVSNSSFAQPIKVILDTDIDSDVDDVGALAMLHTFADHKVIDLLGVIVTSDDRHAPLCTDAINHHFGRPDIPIGVEKGIQLREFSKYTKQVAEEFPHTLKTYEDAEDATDLYRKLLASQPDSSVIVITIGHLTNLRHLLESEADQHSKLSGIDLVKKKVTLWSCMGGQFPEGKEANFYRPDPKSTQVCVEKWPGEVVFAGWEIGNEIITGGAYLEKSLPAESPVRRAYELYNNFEGRQSWDQASILYALSSSNDYWDLQNEGSCIVAEDGSNQWVQEDQPKQAYLLEKMNPVEIAKVIDALMIGIYSATF
ncbi:nucleoside hydrolase [Catalinimonas niigatensis]|uniref:nucleoside hydrolase n=1 Tax=Catalinimonas niigatensis TaxID=1397264 RepID=UPI002664EBEF|nr:nucleoside hydrolase [Catalinimonas niigatensis]WPP50333.1 nucleoside hydrolase [Catalinimonas niigatensis]